MISPPAPELKVQASLAVYLVKLNAGEPSNAFRNGSGSYANRLVMLLYFSLSKRAILCLFFNSLGAVASAFGPEAFDAPTWTEAELIVALEDWFSAAHVDRERAV